MLLELSEVFVCPRCRPSQGLVVMVDRLDGRRVVEGYLGCPGCDLRVPVAKATIRFDRAIGGGGEGAEAPVRPSGAEGELPGLLGETGREEAAVRLAALLGADRAEGYLLLDRSLASLAAGVAARAPGAEVLALADRAGSATETGVTRALGIDPEALPLITGRMGGCALAAPRPGAVREGARVLREEARLALFEPDAAGREALEELPVRVMTDEERAVVCVREAGGFDAPFARFPGGPRPAATTRPGTPPRRRGPADATARVAEGREAV